MGAHPVKVCLALLIAPLLVGAGGCRARGMRDAEFIQVDHDVVRAQIEPFPVAAAMAPPAVELAGPHPVETYVALALSQNPQVQRARKQVEAAALRVPQQASLDDPMIEVTGWPFFPHVPQSTMGRTTADLMVSQHVPWRGKLRTRAQVAEAETNAARARLAAAELDVIERVKRAYYELHYAQQALEITRREQPLLADLTRIAEARLRVALVSQQDVLRAEVEQADLEGELLRLVQQRDSARARLARLLHVSPETPLETLETLSADELPGDIERLYAEAIAARPELHEQLAELERERNRVELARLAYFPDVTLQAGWGSMTTHGAMDPLADGFDMWSIGLAANVPIYRKRLDAQVREAEAEAVAAARQYDALRDQTLEEVKDLFAQFASQQALEQLLRKQILPKSRQAYEVSLGAYEGGNLQIIQVIDNWRQLLRFQLAHRQIEMQLRQTLASLERVIGRYNAARPHDGAISIVPLPEVPPDGS
jgi:outer membrane protein, heavy metal efflux system